LNSFDSIHYAYSCKWLKGLNGFERFE